MTVPAAIKELEKIEMTRQTANIYRLDHVVTAKQKKILKAFGMSEGSINYRAGEISNTLRKAGLHIVAQLLFWRFFRLFRWFWGAVLGISAVLLIEAQIIQ